MTLIVLDPFGESEEVSSISNTLMRPVLQIEITYKSSCLVVPRKRDGRHVNFLRISNEGIKNVFFNDASVE